MYIHIQGEVLEFENNPKNIEKIFTTINDKLNKEGLQFSHLIIDGNVVFDDLYNYFIKNNNDILKVEVVSQTMTELVNETIFSANKYIMNAIPLMSKLAEEFYQQSNEKTWSQLTNLLEGVQWIIQSLTQIDSIKNLDSVVNDYQVWNKYVQVVSKLSDIIPEFESALISKDNILIGDMILYEIVPVFNLMLEKLQFLIPRVVDKGVS